MSGENVEVVNVGMYNTDQGPDFFNAQVRIDDIMWAGNVEIHRTTEEWYAHGHNADPMYDNVVLHVVGHSSGQTVRNSKGRQIPEIEIAWDVTLEARAEQLKESGLHEKRCASGVQDLPDVVRTSWLDALAAERMEQKCNRAENIKKQTGGDPDQMFYTLMARALGGKVNSQPMEQLAQSAPLNILLKHRTSALQVEAILLGQSGLLGQVPTDYDAPYIGNLKKEYKFFQAKFGLQPLDVGIWKYLRLRPTNFPDIRIVQLAALVRSLPGNFEAALREQTTEKGFIQLLSADSPSDYWETHYKLGTLSLHKSKKHIGEATLRIIIINAVVPFLFVLARRRGDTEGAEKAIDLLRTIDTERNSRIEAWHKVGITPRDEVEAQALLQLTTEYCEKGRCMHCRFGHAILAKH